VDNSTKQQLQTLVELLDGKGLGVSLELYGHHFESGPSREEDPVQEFAFEQGRWRIQGDVTRDFVDTLTQTVLRVCRFPRINDRNAYLESEVQLMDRTETTLRLREERLRRLVDFSPFMVVVENMEGGIEYVNKNMEEVLGKDLEDVLGEAIEVVDPRFEFHRAHREQARQMLRMIEREAELVRNEGVNHVHWFIFPEFAPDGELARIVAMGNDVTLRKRSQAALDSSIADYRELFHKSGDVVLLLEPAQGMILDINDGAESSLQMLRSEMVGLTFAELSLRVSSQAFAMREGAWSDLVAAHAVFDWPLKRADGEIHWLQMLFETVEIGGEPRILALGRDVTGQKQHSEQWEALGREQTLFAQAEMVHQFSNLMSVILNGIELLSLSGDEDLRMRLADVRAASNQAAELTRRLVEKSSPSEMKGVILVAEDEPGVLAAVRRILEREGFEVLAARHGDEALSILKNHKGQVDLLLSDVIMPGMAGPDLVAKVRELRPEIAVLYISAYTDTIADPKALEGRDVALLPKPFSAEDLIQAVVSSMNRHAKFVP
jgi:PAS domain S-box-containing protein